MHTNFIRAAGGQVPSKTQSAKERQTADQPTKVYSVEQLRETHPNAYRSWRSDEDVTLTAQYRAGKNIRTLAEVFGRRPGAIRARLKKLGLIET